MFDEQGIRDRRLRTGVVCWEDIRNLHVGTIHANSFLCIELVDERKYLARLPAWRRRLLELNRLVGFPPLSISFVELTPGFNAVRAYLVEQGRMPSELELFPECRHVVEVSDEVVRSIEPGGAVIELALDDLEQVDIVTTDAGPLICDVFWVLRGVKAVCEIPQGATGEPQLLTRLQQLPDFRTEMVMEAMGCTEPELCVLAAS